MNGKIWQAALASLAKPGQAPMGPLNAMVLMLHTSCPTEAGHSYLQTTKYYKRLDEAVAMT